MGDVSVAATLRSSARLVVVEAPGGCGKTFQGASYARDIDPQYVTLLDDTVQMEDEANQFAAELLMPEAACRALAQRYGGRSNPRRLATEFLVSGAAMRWRLKQLGLAS